MLEPVMLILRLGPVAGSVRVRVATTVCSCHTHGDNLVKSGGCTDIAIFDTQDSNRKNHEIGESPPTHPKA